jgi:low temperature requirement protein LtrA
MNSYYNDDLLQRCLILWIMALLILYGNNAPLVSEDIGAMRATVGAYMITRFTIMLTYWIYSFASTEHRKQARIFASLNFIGLAIWIPLLISEDHVSLHAKIAVAVIAIIYEELVWIFSFGPWIKDLLHLEVSTAVDVNHEIDRQAAFFIIVLGEYLYGIVAGSPAAVGLQLRLLRAVETLIIAFSLNWIYVNLDGSIVSEHPLRRSVTSAFIWFIIHLPMAASLLLGGHVASVSVGAEDLGSGLRWMMCGGLGAGLLCLWVISQLHLSKDPPKVLILSKVSSRVHLLPYD